MVYAFPGFMSWDSVTQLAQARRHVYTDDHPPAMAALWHFLEHFVHGPLGMLLVNSVPFLLGLYFLLVRWMSPRRAAVVAVALLWFPPIGTIMAAIFKDSIMASFLIAGTPLLLAERRRYQLLGLALMGAATAMRYNALAATFPLIVLLFRASVGWRRYAISLVAWLGVTIAALGVNRVLADEAKHYWYGSHALMDIAGTLEFSRDYSDDELRVMLDGVPLKIDDHIQQRLRDIYQPVDFRHLDRGPHQVFVPPTTDAERQAIARAWRRMIEANPAAYLHFRWENFVVLMRFDLAQYPNAHVAFMMPWHEDAEAVDYDAAPARIQAALRKAMVAISETHLFDPYFYFALALVLLPFARRHALAIALLLSGLAYQLAWFFLAPTGDYRYSHWLVTTTLLAAIGEIARRRSLPLPLQHERDHAAGGVVTGASLGTNVE